MRNRPYLKCSSAQVPSRHGVQPAQPGHLHRSGQGWVLRAQNALQEFGGGGAGAGDGGCGRGGGGLGGGKSEGLDGGWAGGGGDIGGSPEGGGGEGGSCGGGGGGDGGNSPSRITLSSIEFARASSSASSSRMSTLPEGQRT